MTEEEHHARAALLGRVYDPVDRTYTLPHNDILHMQRVDEPLMIDRDTLKPVTAYESFLRRGTSEKGRK